METSPEPVGQGQDETITPMTNTPSPPPPVQTSKLEDVEDSEDVVYSYLF
jgi:hypothetical protein